MNNRNKNNSSLKQMLLDLEKVLVSDKSKNSIEILKELKTLTKLLEQNETYISKTDKIFNSHRYNDRNIHFTKFKNYKRLQIIKKLSNSTVKVLMYMIQVMSQENLVGIKVKETNKELNMSLNTFRKSIDELETNGCITLLFTGKKDGIGSIYMLNPEIANNSKYDLSEDFKKITSEQQQMNFRLLNDCYSNVITSKTMLNNEIICYNSTELQQTNNNIKKQKNQQNIVTTNSFETDDEELNELFGE